MKIVSKKRLIDSGRFADSENWKRIRASLNKAIRRVDWPVGTGKFTIYPESGKRRGQGNGVTPIKVGLMADLRRQGWRIEAKAKNAAGTALGDFDAVLMTSYGPIVVEWETGNISSSHRSMNKMAMLLMDGIIAAGILVVPSRKLARFLTDRIGNIGELKPYFKLWSSIPCEAGILEIVVIEQDAESRHVRRIPKTTAGRAKH